MRASSINRETPHLLQASNGFLSRGKALKRELLVKFWYIFWWIIYIIKEWKEVHLKESQHFYWVNIGQWLLEFFYGAVFGPLMESSPQAITIVWAFIEQIQAMHTGVSWFRAFECITRVTGEKSECCTQLFLNQYKLLKGKVAPPQKDCLSKRVITGKL